MSTSDAAKPRAKRSLGQNFLQDANICRKIAAATKAGPGDLLLEIGPGQGALTKHLLESGASVLAVEKDRELAPLLKQQWPELGIVLADAMEFPWERLPQGAIIAGNLPYNIASPLLWEIVSRTPDYALAVVMVQHEVGQRLAAPPGGRVYGALGAWVQNFARVEYLFKVPPTVFKPRPKVDSAVMCLAPKPVEERPQNPKALAGLLKLLFSQRRKQLAGILRAHWSPRLEAYLEERGRAPTDRPERLSPEDLNGFALLLSDVFDR